MEAVACTVQGAAVRPYDNRWGSPEGVFDTFHISKHELKKIYLSGWVKARQVPWIDDDHRTQTIYCFEDLHQYLEQFAHRPTDDYIRRFWTAQELAELIKADPKGPNRRR